MKTKNETIKPLPHADFENAIYPSNPTSALPDVDAYFASALQHFSRFAIGTFCWFVPDRLKGVMHMAGGKTLEILGHAPEAFIGHGPELIHGRAHPDDLDKTLAYSMYWVQFLAELAPERRKNFLPCIFLRLMNRQGVYAWVMFQFLDAYLDEHGNTLYALLAFTDVSHVKHTGEAMMSIRDIENNACTCIRCHEPGVMESNVKQMRPITPREREILRHLASGLGSKQIADQLGLSLHTVNHHRQSLLRKAGAKTTAELISYGVMMGHLAWTS